LYASLPALLSHHLPAASLQAGSKERQSLERRIQACQDRIEVLQFCLTLQLTNILSKRQLAVMCLHSHPFVFDTLSICEAMEGSDC
jgi:hypothetical protein